MKGSSLHWVVKHETLTGPLRVSDIVTRGDNSVNRTTHGNAGGLLHVELDFPFVLVGSS